MLRLIRQAISIWGAVKALRGIKPGPAISVTERERIEQEAKRRPRKEAGPENGREALDMRDPPRLIEYRLPAGH